VLAKHKVAGSTPVTRSLKALGPPRAFFWSPFLPLPDSPIPSV
jgi:hypothetical protein